MKRNLYGFLIITIYIFPNWFYWLDYVSVMELKSINDYQSTSSWEPFIFIKVSLSTLQFAFKSIYCDMTYHLPYQSYVTVFEFWYWCLCLMLSVFKFSFLSFDDVYRKLFQMSFFRFWVLCFRNTFLPKNFVFVFLFSLP